MFAGRTTLNVLSRMGMKEGDAIEAPMLSRAVEKAQRKVEERNFQMRKSILDYDEPMEVQRRNFYGRRQPILEGRAIKDVVLKFLDEAVADAVATYLSPMHIPGAISQWVWEAFGVMIDAERFKGKDRDQVMKTILTDAPEEAASQINVTIGEYIPEDSDSSEWDRDGVIEWARNTYGVVITDEIIETEGRLGVVQRLEAASQAKFASIDLSPLEPYLLPGYGVKDLMHWAERMIGSPLDAEKMGAMREPIEATRRMQEAVRAAYRKRELEYPIDFAIEFVNINIQAFPEASLTQFCGWARGRFELNWTPQALPSADPAELRRILLVEAQTWDSNRINDRVTRILAALRAATPAAAENAELMTDAVDGWLVQNVFIRMTDSERAEVKSDPESFLRQRLMRLLREELEQFERFVLLQILDQAWKDHLHSMDQMRDSISFRSFSQKDPRIEFKKESSRLFGEMLSNVRERVTDLVFKGKLSPQAMRPPTPSVVTNETEIDQTAEKIAEPTASAQIASVVPTQAQERDIAIAEQAGAPAGRTAAAVAASGTSMNRAPKVVVPIGGPMAVGRNENCPCGSGKKYKQCCGKK